MLTQDPMSIMAKASRLSISQLQQAIRNGTIPRDIGAIVLSQKIKEQQTAKQAQAMQQPPQPPVAQQAMAYQDPGIAAMPSNLPVYSAAKGGIVAFAGENESLVKDSTAAYNRAASESFLGRGLDAIDEASSLVGDYVPSITNLVKTAGGQLVDKITGMRWVRNPYTGELTRAGKVVQNPNAGKLADMGPMTPKGNVTSLLESEKMTGSAANLLPANIAQIGAPKADAAPTPKETPMIGADRTTYSGGTASRGKGIDSLLKGYNVAKFDDTELKNMMAGENNPETGKPYTYEELAARNKERGIAAGVDYDIYKKQMEELEGKKQPSERRRKMDEAAPWFALSKSLAEAKPGEGWATSLGRGLSSYGESKGQITEKEEVRLEGIRKEANQLALAQNAFVQAEMAGNKADMKAAQDRINAIRMKMSDMGVESTKEQNKAAADVFKAKASMEETLIRERGAWGRASMDKNQITNLANMILKEANEAGTPMTQSQAMEKAAYILKFQGIGLGVEGRAEKDKQALYQKYVDSFRKDLKNYGKNPLEYSDWLATSSFGTGAGGSFSSSGNPDIDAIMKRNMPK